MNNINDSRSIFAEVHGQKYVGYSTKGTPQGGVLSQLIWTLFRIVFCHNLLLEQYGQLAMLMILCCTYLDSIILGIIAEIMTEALHTVTQASYLQGRQQWLQHSN